MTIQTETMSITEKIEAMEALWNDLCRTAESELSPAWHKEVLEQRHASIIAEDSRFEDWETAKRTLRDSLG